MHVLVGKVGNNEHLFLAGGTQESVLAVGVVAIVGNVVGILQVVERALAERGFAVAEFYYIIIICVQGLLLGRARQEVAVAKTVERVYVPIIEDCGTAVASAESLSVHTALAEFLTGINHQRIGAHKRRNRQRGSRLFARAGKEVGGDALLVVVFEEIKHVRADIVHALPLSRDARGRRLAAHDGAERVVKPHFVVEIVKAALQIATVFGGIVHLCHENKFRIFFLHLGNGIRPKLCGHHFRHVAAKTVHALLRPKEQNGRHLVPRVGHRVEVRSAAGVEVHAIVQLNRFVPVVAAWTGREAIVARHLCGIFAIRHIGGTVLLKVLRAEHLPGQVVEIVLRRKAFCHVVALAEVFYAGGFSIGMVRACHVVGHEVYQHFKPCLVRAAHKRLKFLHALFRRGGEVGADVVIVFNGIRRTGFAFHHCGVVFCDAVGRVVGLRGVFQHARVPYMRKSEILDAFQRFGRKVAQFAATILVNVAAGNIVCRRVAVKAGQHLVYRYFFSH